MIPSAHFARRSEVYARLDAQLRDRTRFFAAAALINTAFARLFGVMPGTHVSCSFDFLNEVGAALEMANMAVAREIATGVPRGALDRTLVCAEQRTLQQHVRFHQQKRPHEWKFIRSQLNVFMNDRYLASMSRCCAGVQKLAGVLREVRGELGPTLDFAAEFHRVRIGLTLIEHIRRDAQ